MTEPTPPSTPRNSSHAVHLIDHTIVQSGALFRELLRLYKTLAVGRKSWRPTDLNRLQFRVELVCMISVAISPALRHSHMPIAVRMIQLQVFCDMVSQAGRLVFCEARPFLSLNFPCLRWRPARHTRLKQLAKLLVRRKSELSTEVRDVLPALNP